MDPSEESELESSKDSDAAKLADVKVQRKSSTADKCREGKHQRLTNFQIGEECEELEPQQNFKKSEKLHVRVDSSSSEE